ncbi:MAG TPA: DegT/DnrJ/EryC1/StrS family aminotransferase [bacterium]|nr:DegT/DnrJ/EryC1/StrS family aminotransferase [bacterium]
MKLAFVDVQLEYQRQRAAIDAAIARVVTHGQFILGPEVKELEARIAAMTAMPHGIGVASGTDALILAMRALDIGPGDEVVTTPFTFMATAGAVRHCGATPVFADLDPVTLNLDPAAAAAAVTPRTKAIIVVHLYGAPCAMDAFTALARERQLFLVEDCAHALGATYAGRPAGSFGDIACHSFFPTKMLGAYGDAGMLCARDERLVERLRTLRAHGCRKKYFPDEIGYNSRLDTLQAAVLLAKLDRFDESLRERRQVAAWYDAALAGVARVPVGEGHCAYAYTVRVANRDAVAVKLKEQGIPSMAYYPVALHQTPAYGGGRQQSLPVAEQAAREVLSLPIYPGMTREQVTLVAGALREALA